MKDHFNYLFDREIDGNEPKYGKSSLIDVVDASIANGDRSTAEKFLSVDAGHGRISAGWEIDCSIRPWKEKSNLWASNELQVDEEMQYVNWNNQKWEIYECSLSTADELAQALSTLPKNK